MRLRSELWGLSFLGLLGFVPTGCAGKSFDDTEGGAGTGGSGRGGQGGQGAVVGSGGTVVSGTGGAIGSGGGVVTGGTAGGLGYDCTNPQFDANDGIVRCDDRAPYRAEVGLGCPYTPPPTDGGATGDGGTSGGEGGYGGDIPEPPPSGCDPSLCTEKPRGFCNGGGGFEVPYCDYGCLTDADCSPSQICMCGDSSYGGRCISAGCSTDSECGAGGHCALAYGVCGGGKFLCESAADECSTGEDCESGQCSLGDDGLHRACTSLVCGRPFLVGDEARVAALTTRSDWRERELAAPDLTALNAAERELLAAHWARCGQLEQASIAAFARFALQLLSLGAPAKLVLACGQALQDETAHATLCFELASRYAGESIGPAELAVADCLGAESLADVLELVIAEGCIGETMAAMEAAEAALAAKDPVVRAALERISADETRHAELAWRFARWAIAKGGPELASVARRAFGRHELPRAAGAASSQRLRAHGLLSGDELHDVHRHALRDVIAPCAQALLEEQRDVAPRPALAGC
jgi:hypothetical protein